MRTKAMDLNGFGSLTWDGLSMVESPLLKEEANKKQQPITAAHCRSSLWRFTLKPTYHLTLHVVDLNSFLRKRPSSRNKTGFTFTNPDVQLSRGYMLEVFLVW